MATKTFKGAVGTGSMEVHTQATIAGSAEKKTVITIAALGQVSVQHLNDQQRLELIKMLQAN